MPNPKDKQGLFRILIDLSKTIYEKISKLMDAIVYSHLGALVASLLVAIFISVTINYEDIRTSFFHESRTSVEIEEVKVDVLYDSEVYDVKGIPRQVDVILTGNPAEIQTYREEAIIRVVADLRSKNVGESTIEFSIPNLPENVEAAINPKEVTATISEKITKEFTISPEILVDENQKESDFDISGLKDVTVKVTGSQTKIDSIRMVKAVLDVSSITSADEVSATLVAYDSTGNTVDITIEPTSIKAHVKYKNAQ